MNLRCWPKLLPFCLAFISGGLCNLGFAPFNYYFINYITLAVLLALTLQAISIRPAFMTGFCFGLGLFGIGTSWVFISMHRFGQMNIALSALVTLLFLGCLALLIGLATASLRSLTPKNPHLIHACWLFPTVWVIFEWVRSWFLTGFPWLFLGNTLIHSPLAGWLPILGVYGGSFLVVVIAGGIYGFCHPSSSNQQRWICLIIMVLITLSGQLLKPIQWTQPTHKHLSVSLAQGNIKQNQKWQPTQLRHTADRYQNLTDKHWSSDLIIWPENALPIPKHWAQPILQSLGQQARQHNSTVYVGLPIATPDHNSYFNSLLAIGSASGVYHKRHLVPFGEYIPFYEWFNSWFHFPFAQFQPGSYKQALLEINGIKVAPFICYEIAFPSLVNMTSPQANLLLVTSDDGWFGHSYATWQHLQIAQTQALINNKPLLFANNNGLTSFVNSRGHIMTQLPTNQAKVLTHNLQTYHGHTPWNTWGNWPLLIILLIGLIIAQQKVILRALWVIKKLVRL